MALERHPYDEEKVRRPIRWRRWIVGTLVVLLAAAGVAEWVASRIVASKLRSLVAAKLDAELRLGTLIYVPPYGAWVSSAELVRSGGGGAPLFSVDRLKLKLAQSPLGDGPIIIASLDANRPVVHLKPRGFDQIAREPAGPQTSPPGKLSDVLRLNKVRLLDGKVVYTDPKDPGPPMEWNGLSIDIDTVQKSPSLYTFRAMSRAYPLADASLSGSIDVDTFDLEVAKLSMKSRIEPRPSRTPLAAQMQAVAAKYGINGGLAVTGSGKVALKDPAASAAFSLALAIQDASARFGDGPDEAIDRARASFVCQRSAGGPITLRTDKIDLVGGGKNLVVESGQLLIDPSGAGPAPASSASGASADAVLTSPRASSASPTWKLTDLRGRISMERQVDPLALVAPTAAASPTITSAATTSPPSALLPSASPASASSAVAAATASTQPAARPSGLAKFSPAGRADFTASASGSFDLAGRPWYEAVEHEVILIPRGVSFRPKDFASLIQDINGGEVRLVNGTIVFQSLRGRYGEDVLELRSARLPVVGLPQVTAWKEISGSVTFNPPQRRYSPKLDKFLGPLNPRGTFLIAGSYTVDKTHLRLVQTTTGPALKPNHVYDLIVSSDSGVFSLTSRQIELEKIRGDATITPGGVEIHQAEAQVLGGTMQLTGRWSRTLDSTSPTPATTASSASGYEGEVHFRDVDLARLEDRLRDSAPTGKPLQGKIFADAIFSGGLAKGAGARENLKALRSLGEFEVIDGHLFKIPVLKDVGSRVRELKDAGTVGSAAATFEIADGVAHLRDAAVSAPAVGLQGGGKIGFDGGLELNVVAAPLADWRDKLVETKIPIFSDVAGVVAGGLQKLLNTATGTLLYEFRIEGTVKQPKVTTVPTPVLTDTAAYVFGKMLETPKQASRPRDWLRRPQPPRAERK